ncbi:Rv3235 family protein [Arthrobacter sp. UM1]|uniref:Rv3235 family protein n=1 Tax=Arthrobacter sp. UM1 TaxID=2766776 RepID=UPI001CF68011|nr:Rv3235 family protein [Arthrobacter sp. UM1]MCB4207774.1 hypothetical protein [Arthrobacter sp. UM1]
MSDSETWTAAPADTEALEDRPLVQAGPFARAAVAGVLEVLAGARPVRQLEHIASPSVIAKIGARAALLRAAMGAMTVRSGLGFRPARLGAARICWVSPWIAEACIVCHSDLGARACALRLERRRGQWTVTALELG